MDQGCLSGTANGREFFWGREDERRLYRLTLAWAFQHGLDGWNGNNMGNHPAHLSQFAPIRVDSRFPHSVFLSGCFQPLMKSSTAAMQMQESATLKAGHQPPLEGTILS
jgi:hypothetical protein